MFVLELPVLGHNIRLPEAAPAHAAPDVPKGTRALVIEDEQALGDAQADGATQYKVLVTGSEAPRLVGRPGAGLPG